MTQPPALADPALPFDGALGAALPLLASRVGAGLAETLQARPNRRDLPHSSAALLDRCQATDALPPAL
ncbi:MAG: hypothetical protein M3O01_02745, partial [Pseudomonadota bacterium]|nr:hypothetical protein [Pseudomonadota bacterium]